MGYKPDRKVFKLVFDDPSMDGLEVKATSLDIGALFKVTEIRSKKILTQDDVEEMFSAFANALRSWNVEDDDGNPVPTDLAGIYSQELTFIQTIIWAWVDAITGVSDELGKESGSGETFPEGSLPMEPLSESQAS
jgi:hypothetical protein